MSKKIKGIITVLILSIILVMHISYAITNEKKSEFFTVNKSEISPEETLEMTIDISKIQYKKFTFKLDTNVEVKEIYAKENTDVNIDNKSNDVNIDIDKSTINLDKITLYYVIPKDTTIGTKIQLTAQILAEEENESNNNANKIEKENIVNIDNTANVTNTAVQNNTEMKDSETKAEEKVVEKVKLEILVVEKKDDNKQENENNNEDKKETQEQDGKQGNKSDLGNSQDQTKNTAQNAKTTSNANVKVTSSANSSNQVVETETAVYEGSRNNYL